MNVRTIFLLSGMSLIPMIAAAQAGRLVLPDLSKLSQKASESVNISLDPSMLEFAAGALGTDTDPAIKELIAGLQGIYVRSYTFEHDDAYSKTDVDAVRTQLVEPWAPLVSTHDQKQHSDVDIFVRHRGDRTEGIVIIASERREFTVVNIVGSIDLAKLAQLQGHLGVPKMAVSPTAMPEEKGSLP